MSADLLRDLSTLLAIEVRSVAREGTPDVPVFWAAVTDRHGRPVQAPLGAAKAIRHPARLQSFALAYGRPSRLRPLNAEQCKRALNLIRDIAKETS
ncbi:MAG: hypothetical protein JWM64_239 [Frankiales bacterium]|nr:hypothetical protein [Frankiales bacterium]